jgi:hypothetical protein
VKSTVRFRIIKSRVYQKGGDGSESYRLIATKVGVAQKGSDQCAQVGSTIEDGDDSCSCNALHVEDSSEIYQEVGQGSNGS